MRTVTATTEEVIKVKLIAIVSQAEAALTALGASDTEETADTPDVESMLKTCLAKAKGNTLVFVESLNEGFELHGRLTDKQTKSLHDVWMKASKTSRRN